LAAFRELEEKDMSLMIDAEPLLKLLAVVDGATELAWQRFTYGNSTKVILCQMCW
jgi:hypothetical protein